MNKKNAFSLPRRTFMASGFLLGNTLLGVPLALGSNDQTAQKTKKTLSKDEKKWIAESTLAEDLSNYFGMEFSCAESLLMVSLRFLGKPEEWVWAAAGFGGGMYNRDLCGFITGGIMGLGFASGMLKMPRKEAKEYCGGLVKEYWDWWKMQSPLHCVQITEGRKTYAACMNLGLLSAAKIEEFLKQIENKA